MTADKEDTPSMVTPVTAIGVPGYGRSVARGRGHVLEEFHPKLRGRQALRVFREMADNSAICGALLQIVEAYVTQADFKIEPADDAGPVGEFYADFVETVFDDMNAGAQPVTRNNFLSDVLTMVWAGFAYHEMTYKVRRGPDAAMASMRSKHCDGFYGVANIESRAQETIESWKWDNGGHIVGAFQQAPPEGRTRYLPLDGLSEKDGAPVQCVHFKTKNARGNPEGRSFFRNGYRDWWGIKRIEEFESIGIEKDLAGVLTFEVPPDVLSEALTNTTGGAAATVTALRKVSERARRGEYEGLVIPGKNNSNGEPTGYAGYLMQSGGRKPMDQDAVIKRKESRLALSFLAEGVLLGMQGSAGSGSSWSLASSKTGMLAMMVNGLMQSIAEIINGVIIPRLMDANGWPIEMAPRVCFGDLEADDMAALLPAISGAVGSGSMVSGPNLDKWIRDRVGIPQEAEISSGMLQDRVGEISLAEATQPEPQEIVADDTAPGADDEELDDEEEIEAEAALERGMTVEEAAAQVGVSPGVIRNAIATGQIPGAKFGRSYRVMNTDLRNYVRGGAR